MKFLLEHHKQFFDKVSDYEIQKKTNELISLADAHFSSLPQIYVKIANEISEKESQKILDNRKRFIPTTIEKVVISPKKSDAVTNVLKEIESTWKKKQDKALTPQTPFRKKYDSF